MSSSSTLPYPPLHTNSPFVVLSDWDGTITDKDSNDYLTDNMGMGYEARRALNHKVLDGSSNFRDTFHEMLQSVHHPFSECKEALQKTTPRSPPLPRGNASFETRIEHPPLPSPQPPTGPHHLFLFCTQSPSPFPSRLPLPDQLTDPRHRPRPRLQNFYDYCKSASIPFVIVSSGMEPTIRAVLETLLPAEDAQSIDIISNNVKFTDPEGKGDTWEIVYRHPESGFGHDKSKAILPYRDLPHTPTLFFCGDGVSGDTPRQGGNLGYICRHGTRRERTALMPDLSAAAHADVLFAKEMANGDSDLMQYCKREKIPFVPFRDFNKILERVKEIVEGKDFREVLKEEGN